MPPSILSRDSTISVGLCGSSVTTEISSVRLGGEIRTSFNFEPGFDDFRRSVWEFRDHGNQFRASGWGFPWSRKSVPSGWVGISVGTELRDSFNFESQATNTCQHHRCLQSAAHQPFDAIAFSGHHGHRDEQSMCETFALRPRSETFRAQNSGSFGPPPLREPSSPKLPKF